VKVGLKNLLEKLNLQNKDLEKKLESLKNVNYIKLLL
jgi:hypothetical protein